MTVAAKQFRQKPIEFVSALVMPGTGTAAAALLSGAAWQTAGAILAAFGGALMSWSAVSVDTPQKARKVLSAELHVIARHLADTVSRINRAVQAYESDEPIDAAVAIDRVSQFTSGLYGIVNDLRQASGAQVDFDDVIETVSACEEMAEKLETLSALPRAGTHVEEDMLNEIREEISNLRLNLVTARRTLTSPESVKTVEEVRCPICSTKSRVEVGAYPGDSQIVNCNGCKTRYHVHRRSSGEVFTRPWGGEGARRIVAKCPKCGNEVPATFKRGSPEEKRFCMKCSTKLTIGSTGEVLEQEASEPVEARASYSAEGRILLECRTCKVSVPSIWWDDNVYRGGCPECGALLEAPKLGDQES